MSEDVHANIAAIQKMEVANDRLTRTVADRLSVIRNELRRVSEALEDRRNDLKQEISRLRSQISSADVDENTSWEESCLEDAKDSLRIVERRIQRFSDADNVFETQARGVAHLANENGVRGRKFLLGAVDDLKAYFAATPGETFANAGAGSVSSFTSNTKNTTEPSAINQRAAIAAAIYTHGENIRSGVNKKLKLYNGKTVIFKPANGECKWLTRDGILPGTLHIREVAASIIDEALGLNLVPATEFISFAGNIDGNHYNGGRGSAQLFKTDYLDAKDIRYIKGFYLGDKLTERQRHDFHLFDYITGQSDRHEKNWMACEQGSGYSIIMIDNGLCLRTNSNWTMHNKPATGASLDMMDKTRLNKFINGAVELRERLTGIGLEPKAIDLMFDRANDLLREGKFLTPPDHVN